jgi:mRNA interferase RelE/StbE
MDEVLLAPSAARDLDGIRDPDLGRIKVKILSLAENSRPFNSLKLKGSLYRVRAGDWRILYAIDDRLKRVTVLRVLRRSERTYRGL